MKKSLLLVGLLLMGCDDLSGTLQVSQTLTLKDKKGKAVQIEPGVIQAKLDYDEDDGKKEIELKWEDARGKNQKVKFLVPSSMNIPKNEGHFELPAAQSGQAYDLVGDITTDVRESGPIQGSESCTYTDIQRVCRIIREQDRRGRWHEYERCHDEYVTRYGRREITYHTTTTKISGKADLVDGARGAIATFDGANTQTVPYTDYTGPCYRF
jgi:hypothetical protein